MRSRTGLAAAAVAVALFLVGVARAFTLLHHHSPADAQLPITVGRLDHGRVIVGIPTGGADAPVRRVSVPVSVQSPASITQAISQAGAEAANVNVSAPMGGAPSVPSGFVGLSVEDQAVPVYSAQGGLFAQLLSNLSPGARPVIRLGGDSADHAWVPVRARPNPGLNIDLTHAWFASLQRLASSTGARFVADLNLEADLSWLPPAEVSAFRQALGSSLLAFEPGNEPDLYTVFPYYSKGHSGVLARSRSWDPAQFIAQLKRTLPAVGSTPLWGPSLDDGSRWWNSVDAIVHALPHLSTVTDHAYATNCYVAHTSAHWPTVSNLVAPTSSAGLVSEVTPALDFARRTGRAFRIDETNTVACGGSQSLAGFANALWPIQVGFAFAGAGVSGVNIETAPTAKTRMFSFGPGPHSGATVSDEYYGWMLFARAAPAGARLLSVSSGGDPGVSAAATRTPTGTNVVLTNDSDSAPATVTLSGTGGRIAVIEPLRGAGLSRSGGMSFDGMAIDGHSGRLSGTPQLSAVSGPGQFSITLPPASADLVTVTGG